MSRSASLVRPPVLKRRDAPESALCVSDRQTAFFPLHAGDGREGHRVLQSFLKIAETILANSARIGPLPSPTPSPGRSTPTASRSSALARCCNYCSATSAGPAPASWRSAATRPLGFHGYSRSTTRFRVIWRRRRRSKARYLAGLHRGRDDTDGLLGEHAEIYGLYLKSVYGDAATKENQFGYDWHPKILGDHSHMAMFVAMNAGAVKG